MNERSSAFWEVFCQIFVENTEANNFPPHHFAHRSFEFFAGEFVEAKKSSGTVQTFFRLRGFSAPKTPRFAGQKHHRLRKKYQFEQGAQVFLIPIFFWVGGGYIYIYRWRFSKKDPKRHHPSIHLCWGKGCQHPPRLHRFNPLGSQETEGRPSEHQELMLTILTGKFGFFQREKTRQQQQKREEKKTAWPRKSQSDVCFLIWFQFCSIDASYIF